MYFFDTYALIEIIKGSMNYDKFKECAIVTGVLNLGELYWVLLREFNKKTADYWYKNMNFDLIDISPDLILKAVHFRFLNRKKKLSLIDCVGYVTSLHYGLRFLTGDKEFETMKQVEFVK